MAEHDSNESESAKRLSVSGQFRVASILKMVRLFRGRHHHAAPRPADAARRRARLVGLLAGVWGAVLLALRAVLSRFPALSAAASWQAERPQPRAPPPPAPALGPVARAARAGHVVPRARVARARALPPAAGRRASPNRPRGLRPRPRRAAAPARGRARAPRARARVRRALALTELAIAQVERVEASWRERARNPRAHAARADARARAIRARRGRRPPRRHRCGACRAS